MPIVCKPISGWLKTLKHDGGQASIEECRLKLSQIATKVMFNEYEIAWWIVFIEKLGLKLDSKDDRVYEQLLMIGFMAKHALMSGSEDEIKMQTIVIKEGLFPDKETIDKWRHYAGDVGNQRISTKDSERCNEVLQELDSADKEPCMDHEIDESTYTQTLANNNSGIANRSSAFDKCDYKTKVDRILTIGIVRMEDGQKHHYVSNRFSGKRREYKHMAKLRKWKE